MVHSIQSYIAIRRVIAKKISPSEILASDLTANPRSLRRAQACPEHCRTILCSTLAHVSTPTTGMTPPLRVAGVPEAFNLPFSTADFSAHGLTRGAELVSHPGGSGAMLQSLKSGEVDVAFALTDCIVAAISNGAPVRLAGPVVTSPLTWAVCVAPRRFSTVSELHSATWGISRRGSGSHVMVRALAAREGWKEPSFEVCGDFDGLRAGLDSGHIHAFLWEHYTTRPYEESGAVAIIGGVPTPWGCFSAAVREDCAVREEVRMCLDAFLAAGAAFAHDAGSIARICSDFRMNGADAAAWLAGVRYARVGETRVDSAVLEKTRDTLVEAGVARADGAAIETFYL